MEIRQTYKADKHIVLNHKFINDSLNWEYNKDQATVMDVGSKKKRSAIQYQIRSKSGRFDTFDKRVYNAVCSLYEAGNAVLTPSMVYRQMNGLQGREKVSDASIKRIEQSIDKCRHIKLGIEFSDDLKNYSKADGSVSLLQDALISAEKVIVQIKGQETLGYQLQGKPILYAYVQLYSNQIMSIDTELLNVKSHVKRESFNTMLLKEYLIRRIEIIKDVRGRTSNRILFDRIYEELQIEHPSPKQVRSVREGTEKILLSFKEKGYIKNYDLYRSGKAFKGIEVFH